jgi:uncharacterized protein YndB with AHSA1/START domain
MVEDFVISRTFNAPRDLVWKCFTDPERMKEWWGPKGFKVIASKMDLRPGGSYHYGLQSPNGQPMWGKLAYHEIVPPEKLVLINSFSRKGRHDVPSRTRVGPQMPTFTSRTPGGKTKFMNDGLNAMMKDLRLNRNSMTQGCRGTFEQLEAYLAKAT